MTTTKKKTITALKLTTTGELEWIKVSATDLRDIAKEIGCDWVELVRVSDSVDMWVDEEGTRDGDLNVPALWLVWKLHGAESLHPLFGHVVFTSSEDEELTSLNTQALQDIRAVLNDDSAPIDLDLPKAQ